LKCRSRIQLKVLKLSVVVGKVSIILKYYVASLDDQCITLRDRVMVSSPSIGGTIKNRWKFDPGRWGHYNLGRESR